MPFHSFIKAVIAHPDSTAVIRHNKKTISYCNLLSLINVIAAWLMEQRAQYGDKVILHNGNSIELIASYYACLATGAIFNPPHPHLSDQDICRIITDSRGRFYLGDAAAQDTIDHASTLEICWVASQDVPFDQALFCRSLLRPNAHFSPPTLSPALIVCVYYTFGMTGHPKGFPFLHKVIITIINALCSIMALSVESISTAPLYSMVDVTSPWFIQTLFAALSLQYFVMLTDTHAPYTAFGVLNTYESSWITSTPATFNSLIIAAQQLDHVSVLSAAACVSGGDTCPPETAQRFHLTFDGHLQNSYKHTEQGYITIHHPNMTNATVPSSGGLLSTTGIKIVPSNRDVGELFIRSPAKTAGLWTPEGIKTVYEDGWIFTGDLARQLPDSSLNSLVHQKDLIKVAGYPIYPLEVEKEISKYPDIAGTVVFAIPDMAQGEAIIAMIKIRRGKTLSAAMARHYLSDKISRYKIPRKNIFVDNILTPNNKINHCHIAKEYLRSLSKEIKPLK